MAELGAGASAPPVKKFSLFKKKLTLSQAPEPKPGQNHTDAFSRARELFPIHIKEKEIKRGRKAASLERKRSSQSREKSASSPRQEKKRKVANDFKVESVNLDVEDSETEDEEPQARYLQTWCMN